MEQIPFGKRPVFGKPKNEIGQYNKNGCKITWWRFKMV